MALFFPCMFVISTHSETSFYLAESWVQPWESNLQVRLYWLIGHHIHFENGKASCKHFLGPTCHLAALLDVFWSPDKYNVMCPSRFTILCTATSIYNLSRWIHSTGQDPLSTHFSVKCISLATGQMWLLSHCPQVNVSVSLISTFQVWSMEKMYYQAHIWNSLYVTWESRPL